MFGLGTILKIGGSLLGASMSRNAAKNERKTALNDEMVKFERLREGAIRGGFNPLTALQNGGLAGLSGLPSGTPPLASIDLITGAIQDVSREMTGEAAQEREQQRLQNELAKLNIEHMRALVKAGPSAVIGPRVQSHSGWSASKPQLQPKATVKPRYATRADEVLAEHHWSGEKPIPSHIPVRTASGHIVDIINPQLPDADQLMLDPVFGVQVKGAQAGDALGIRDVSARVNAAGQPKLQFPQISGVPVQSRPLTRPPLVDRMNEVSRRMRDQPTFGVPQ